jgi:hypothetical protein
MHADVQFTGTGVRVNWEIKCCNGDSDVTLAIMKGSKSGPPVTPAAEAGALRLSEFCWFFA